MKELKATNIENLYKDIVLLIENTKNKVMVHVNTDLIELYGILEKALSKISYAMKKLNMENR